MCFLSFSLHMLAQFFSHLCLIFHISSIKTECKPTSGKFCKNRKIVCICFDIHLNIVETGIFLEDAYTDESRLFQFWFLVERLVFTECLRK